MRFTIIAATFCVALTLLLLMGSGISSTAAAPPQATTQEIDPKVTAFLKPVEIANGDSDLQKKLKERHNVAVRLLDDRVQEYKSGVRDASFVFDAARLAADAKLDLAETADARAATLQQVLDITKLIEDRLQQQLDKGFGSKADLQHARFNRLSVEVEILKAKK